MKKALVMLLVLLSPNLYAHSNSKEECLVYLAWGEARGEEFSGKVALMYAALHHAKYEHVHVCRIKAAKRRPPTKLFYSLLNVARLVSRGLIYDPSKGATHWRARRPQPFGTKVAVIGGHVFSKAE